MTNPFIKNTEEVDKLLETARKVAKGRNLADVDIEPAWMHTYAQIARCARDDSELVLTRYQYEAGPFVGAFVGGFLEHKEWPLCRGLEGQQSMPAVMEYETNYINAAGFWMAFNEATISLRQEALTPAATMKARSVMSGLSLASDMDSESLGYARSSKKWLRGPCLRQNGAAKLGGSQRYGGLRRFG